MKVTIRYATSIFCVYLGSAQPAKVNLNLCFIKHEIMKAYEGAEVPESHICNLLDGR